MHVVALIVAALAGAAVWYWRLKALKQAGDDLADMAGRVRGAYRVRRFRKKAEGSVLNGIDDPALAAAVFLFALANENAGTLHLSDVTIRDEIARVVPPTDLPEIVAYARWAARDLADSRDVVRRFKSLWRERLNRDEREQFVAMAEAVLALGRPHDHAQALSVDALRQALLP